LVLIGDHLLLFTAIFGNLIHHLVDIPLNLQTESSLYLLVEAMLQTESPGELFRLGLFATHDND
jgi:hypothetical protein